MANGKKPTVNKPDNTPSVKIHLIYSLVIVVVVSVFSFLIFKSNKPGTVKLQLGDIQIEMRLDGDTLSVKKMLDILFSDSEKARESFALLKEFGKLYQVNDPSIVNALEEQDKDSKVAQNLRSLLHELRGPFVRSTHTFYNVQNPDIVNAIEKLGFNHPVSKELRELLIYRRGPFEEQATEVFLSVPVGNPIAVGRAASCKSNRFYRREARVFNKQRTSSISVYVNYSFPCPEESEGYEINGLLQLSYADMKKLIGDSPITEKETGFAEIMLDVE